MLVSKDSPEGCERVIGRTVKSTITSQGDDFRKLFVFIKPGEQGWIYGQPRVRVYQRSNDNDSKLSVERTLFVLILERNVVKRHMDSINGLAGIIVLAPKLLMLVLYDVQLCFAHVNTMPMPYATQAGLPYIQETVGSYICSLFIDLIMVANLLDYGASEPDQV